MWRRRVKERSRLGGAVAISIALAHECIAVEARRVVRGVDRQRPFRALQIEHHVTAREEHAAGNEHAWQGRVAEPTEADLIERITERLRKDHPDPAEREKLYADSKLPGYVRALARDVTDDTLLDRVAAAVQGAEDHQLEPT